MAKLSSSLFVKATNSTTATYHTDSDDIDYSDSDSDLTDTEAEQQQLQLLSSSRRRHRGRDVFSQLPANVLQQILGRLPPFQMLTISELSHKFYNFVVLGQEMNEVWFRLVKHEEAEEKKRLDWFKQKKLEQERRSVQMLLNSSSVHNMSDDPSVMPISKQAQRLLNKKQEAAGKSSASSVKVMKRSDRKKNWCKIYVDSILRGNGDDPLEALSQVVAGSAKRPAKFQTIVLNEPLAQEHFKEYDGRSSEQDDDGNGASKELSREAKTQAKIDKRMYYKSIRSKPKGKKAGQMDTTTRLDKAADWRQPEWSGELEAGDY
ncbi:hypothetical protein BGZ99_002628 [Dissophora globulifera]|uniref:F-box domain-containing protein n=1 Tax=Dissophora globulifera TaxID=979702 RepID=A0A9P6QXU4_9FUNG|nr:hypothetical protein BGZ99_002628 [Dissophora globulifera]